MEALGINLGYLILQLIIPFFLVGLIALFIYRLLNSNPLRGAETVATIEVTPKGVFIAHELLENVKSLEVTRKNGRLFIIGK